MTAAVCSGSDENEGEGEDVVESPSRRSSAPRYARLGKRSASPAADDIVDHEEHRLTLSRRAVPTNFRFAGLGKRRVSLAYKAAGLGKRADETDYWSYGGRPEPEIGRTSYVEPAAFDDYIEYGPEAVKRRVSTAMRYAGLGKRQQRSRVDAGMRYMGVGRRAPLP